MVSAGKRTELDLAAEARGSGESDDVGALRPCRRVRSVAKRRVLAQRIARRSGQLGRGQWQRCRGPRMAACAIAVIQATAGAIVAGLGGIATALMHMLMVSRMLAGNARRFVRAIGRGCRPDELHGQHQQHEDDDEPTTHGRGFYGRNQLAVPARAYAAPIFENPLARVQLPRMGSGPAAPPRRATSVQIGRAHV